ncbi:MAG: hypothetical protein KAS30_02865, partial [Candidatus Diapherotrites archaeon]|nr:hypothetical protein [Candidatus Diapherotrites archaeon]
MTGWGKKETNKNTVDFESLEKILQEILIEAFESGKIDPEKPIQLNFSISMQKNGKINIDEYGFE